LRQAVKQALHLAAALEATRAVAAEQTAGGVEMGVVAHAGEDVQYLAFRGAGVEDAVGGQERDFQFPRQAGGGFEDAVFPAPEMALHLDEDAVCAEDAAQPAQEIARGLAVIAPQGFVKRTFLIAGEANEAGGELGQFIPTDGALRLGAAEFGARDQAAEVLVAEARLDQQRQDGAVVEGQLGADDRADAGFAGGGEKTRGTVDAVAIAEGERGHFEFRAALGELRRRGSAAQEAERAAGMKFDVVHES
jgi:hypothetical protein